MRFRLVVEPQGKKWAWKVQVHEPDYYGDGVGYWMNMNPWHLDTLPSGTCRTLNKAETKGRMQLARFEAYAIQDQRKIKFAEENTFIIEH